MKIKITQENIDRGNSCRKLRDPSTHCPIYFALLETNKFQDVCVGTRNLYITLDKKEFQIELPLNIKLWIENFDYGKEVFPVEFELDIERIKQNE